MLRALWALAVFLVVTPVVAGSAFVVSLWRGDTIDLRPAVTWSRAILGALGARVEYSGLEHRPVDAPCVFVANHQSNADIWAVAPALPLDTKFVAKASLFRIPFLGWAMRRAGFVAIDRSQRRSAIESLRAAVAVISGGRPIILFPEGTRSRSGELRPFKKGPFHLAIQAAVPVVPVVIDGSWDVL